MHQSRRGLDDVQPSSAEYSKDGSHVVRISPPTASTANESTVDRKWHCGTSQLSPRSRYPSRCWPYHADSRHENCRQLLCSSPPDHKHSPVSWSVGASIPRLFCGAFTVELRVCRSGWAASPVTRQAPVSAQRCCTADICEYSAQPRDALRTVFLSYFQSLEPVDSSGYDRRQQHADPAIPCDNHAMSTMLF